MAYYTGSTYDRQSRRAIIANDHGQLDGPLPLRSNAGEVAPVGDTTLSTRLPPNGYRRSRDYSWDWSSPPLYMAGQVAPVGTQFTELPPRGRERKPVEDYTWLQSIEMPVYGELPYGQQSTDNLPPQARPRSRDYSWTDQYKQTLIGQDAMNAGVQSTDLPPRGPARSRDYSYVDTLFAPLIGADAMVTGVQSTELPPKGRQRAATLSDTPYNLTVWLDLASQVNIGPGKSTDVTALPPRGAARSRDYSYTLSVFPALIGTDFMVPGIQSDKLPPRRYPRLSDYTWQQSFSLPTYGELPFGQQTTDNVAPRRAARSIWFDQGTNFTLALDFAASQVPPQGKTTAQTELPPRAYARSRDYTFVHATDQQLIGQDSMVTGKQLTPENPRGPQRAAQLYDPLANQTLIPDFIQSQTIAPGKSTDATALPPRGAARSRDYTFLHLSDTQLIGQDAMATGEQTTALPPKGPQRAASLYDPQANFTLILDAATGLPPGEQSTDNLPPRGTQRSRDYTWLHQTDRQLIGQDAMPTGRSTDATALPPRGPARSRDYTWFQTYPLHVYEQLPPGDTTAPTELPPRAYQRMRDYTFLHPTDQQLIGQDFMVPGQSSLRTDNLPPRAPARLRDYTYLLRFDLSNLAAATHAGHHSVSDGAESIHTLFDRAKFVHTLFDRAKMIHTVNSTG